MNALNRRQVLTGALAVAGAFGVSACGEKAEKTENKPEAGGLPGSNDTPDNGGNVSQGNDGNAVFVEVPAAERKDPEVIEGTTMDGAPWTSADYADQVLVVNSWFAACPPCRHEAPVLSEVSKTYNGHGVQFVGVNVRDSVGPARAFEENFKIEYPSLRGKEGKTRQKLAAIYPSTGVPVTLLFDRQHRLAAAISGAVDKTTLTGIIERILSE